MNYFCIDWLDPGQVQDAWVQQSLKVQVAKRLTPQLYRDMQMHINIGVYFLFDFSLFIVKLEMETVLIVFLTLQILIHISADINASMQQKTFNHKIVANHSKTVSYCTFSAFFYFNVSRSTCTTLVIDWLGTPGRISNLFSRQAKSKGMWFPAQPTIIVIQF